MQRSDRTAVSSSSGRRRTSAGQGLAALEAASELILACNDRESISAAIHVLKELLGLEHIVYHGVRYSAGEMVQPYLALSYDPAWVQRYIDQDYFRVDPIVYSGARQLVPFDWSDARKAVEGARVREMFAEAERYGVGRHGLTIPLRGPNGERAIFTVTSNADEVEWRLYRASMIRILVEIGQYMHDRVASIVGSRIGVVPSLSRREQQCLQMMAYGKLPKEISYSLGLSESAVRLYLHSARHKLGSATLYQAIGRAVAHKLVTP